MSERDVREGLAEALAEPLCAAICDLLGEPRILVPGEVSALLTRVMRRPDVADALAQMLAEAEQRGREDNADHGMCYVYGSKALDARLAEARAEALREAAGAWQWGEWTALTAPIKAETQPQRILGAAQAVTDWLRSRAALTTEADQ